MHDDLLAAGLRRTRRWTVALLLAGVIAGGAFAGLMALDPAWPPSDARIAGGSTTLAVGAALGGVGVALLLVAGERSGTRRAWPTVPVTPAPRLRPVVEGIALAHGIPVPRVWHLDAGSPNVAALGRPGGRHVVVSSGAEGGLTPDELEAVLALQLGLLLHPDAARVRRPLVAAGLALTWILRLALLAMLVGIVRHPSWAGLTINLAIWVPAAVAVPFVVAQRRLRWSWGLVGDAVAIGTTRHPQALVAALRRLAGYNGAPVPVRRTFGAADPYWVLPVRARAAVATMVVDGRARTRSSTEQVTDAALLLRAGIVERATRGADPVTLATWREAHDTFERLARAAGDGGGPNPRIDGVEVTVDGAQAGALAPVGNRWPGMVAADAGGLDLRGVRRARPPDASALAAYDRTVGTGGR